MFKLHSTQFSKRDFLLLGLGLALLALLTTAASAVPADNAKAPMIAGKMIFNARDYGAKGDGAANDSEAIQLAIDAAIRAGARRTVSIPAGRYYLGPVRDGRDKWAYFRIEGNPDHLTIEGAGADKTVFLTGGTAQPFVVRGASNLVIRGFSVDWKTLNCTQGVITAVDAENGTYRVKMDEGYAAPNAEIFQKNDRYKPEIRVLSPGRNTFGWREETVIESVEAQGKYWIFHVSKTDPNGDQGKIRLAQVGQRFSSGADNATATAGRRLSASRAPII